MRFPKRRTPRDLLAARSRAFALPDHEGTRLRQLAEFHLREGKPAEARRIYRAMLGAGVAAAEDLRFARRLRTLASAAGDAIWPFPEPGLDANE